MPTLTSKLNLRSEEFKAASTLMRQLVDRLGLSPMDSALARQRVQGGGSVQGM